MTLERRQFLTASLALGAATAAPGLLAGNTTPSRYPDATWQVIDKQFEKYMLFNTPLERQWTGGLWLEGPAWNAVGRYAVFSDIPRALQMRWDEATGEVSVLRRHVGHSNGHTFDDRGRLIACEHSPARVVRYEWDGSLSVLADQYNGKPLNAPNDVVALKSGGVIFTDPGYGAHVDYEGKRRTLELETAVYYWQDGLKEPRVLTTELYKPNGIALGPDGSQLYITDTAPSHHPDQPATITRFNLQDGGQSLSEPERLVESSQTGYDGLTCDVEGNLWVGTSGGEGTDGVSVFSVDGTLIGRVLLPEICANVCFTGENRNRLLMTASQSIYTLYTATQGA
ncbi:SMP-30/gluconolactonase/LRE family protein [Halomonas sabkhae]|uniref:SMP-30/gluconolactonase/LRE family protein n=1 Tax=Halomonas sabkhae TaxID=626223 RepID=UPI0025B401A4|nr:SMP-30/gluconolactonase/LRE family protein [Halomonas sabkhae]MDN3524604.1 SMP-30/gluconolactonase/LRE family protein [Halomonas sabkhae]